MLCRMIVVMTGILNLTSCVVADMDSTNHTSVPWIQVFQKVDSTGQTNSHERKEALYSCGVDRHENLDDINWGLNTVYNNQTIEEMMDRKDRVISCMKSKGYQVYGFEQCGPLKAPSGLCPN